MSRDKQMEETFMEICIKAFDIRKGMKLCTIVSNPDKNGFVLVVSGHFDTLENRSGILKMQKKWIRS